MVTRKQINTKIVVLLKQSTDASNIWIKCWLEGTCYRFSIFIAPRCVKSQNQLHFHTTIQDWFYNVLRCLCCEPGQARLTEASSAKSWRPKNETSLNFIKVELQLFKTSFCTRLNFYYFIFTHQMKG